MGTNAMAPDTAALPPEMQKAFDTTAQNLGMLIKECAEYDPTGQICGALTQMLNALGGIEKQVESMSGGAAPDAGAYPVPPGQQGPMDQAGAALAAQLGAGGPPSPNQ